MSVVLKNNPLYQTRVSKATSLHFSHELTVKDRQAFRPNLSDEQ